MVTSGHVTKMAVTPFDPPYPKTHANIMALCLIERDYLSKFYIVGVGIFDLLGSCDLDPMTFIYELDPWDRGDTPRVQI